MDNVDQRMRGSAGLGMKSCLAGVILVFVGCSVVKPTVRTSKSISAAQALARLAKAVKQDFRLNDREKLSEFIAVIHREATLVGLSREQLESALGPGHAPWPNMRLQPNEEFWQIGGTVPLGLRAGPASMVVHFDAHDRVDSVRFFASQ